jgi:hypothetical protein
MVETEVAESVRAEIDAEIEKETEAVLTRARTRASITSGQGPIVVAEAKPEAVAETPHRVARLVDGELHTPGTSSLREALASGAMPSRTSALVSSALVSVASDLASARGDALSAVTLALLDEIALLSEELRGKPNMVDKGTQTPKPPAGPSPRAAAQLRGLGTAVMAANKFRKIPPPPDALPPRPPPGPPPGMSAEDFKVVQKRRESLPDNQRPWEETQGWNLLKKAHLATAAANAFSGGGAKMPGADSGSIAAALHAPVDWNNQRTVVIEGSGPLGLALADRFRHGTHEAVVVTSVKEGSLGMVSGVRVGDVMYEINGVPAHSFLDKAGAIRIIASSSRPLTFKLSAPSFKELLNANSTAEEPEGTQTGSVAYTEQQAASVAAMFKKVATEAAAQSSTSSTSTAAAAPAETDGSDNDSPVRLPRPSRIERAKSANALKLKKQVAMPDSPAEEGGLSSGEENASPAASPARPAETAAADVYRSQFAFLKEEEMREPAAAPDAESAESAPPPQPSPPPPAEPPADKPKSGDDFLYAPRVPPPPGPPPAKESAPRPPPGPPPGMSTKDFKVVQKKRLSLPESDRPAEMIQPEEPKRKSLMRRLSSK